MLNVLTEINKFFAKETALAKTFQTVDKEQFKQESKELAKEHNVFIRTGARQFSETCEKHTDIGTMINDVIDKLSLHENAFLHDVLARSSVYSGATNDCELLPKVQKFLEKHNDYFYQGQQLPVPVMDHYHLRGLASYLFMYERPDVRNLKRLALNPEGSILPTFAHTSDYGKVYRTFKYNYDIVKNSLTVDYFVSVIYKPRSALVIIPEPQ